MKATVTVEIEIQDDIEALYPNFIFNYEDKQDFLEHQIARLNHNLNHHSNYDVCNDGYKQKVLKVKIGAQDEK